MLIPSRRAIAIAETSSLSRRVNANSQRVRVVAPPVVKLIKKGEC